MDEMWFVELNANYIDPDSSVVRFAFVTSCDDQYVYGFYWRPDSRRRSGFRMTLARLESFVQVQQ